MSEPNAPQSQGIRTGAGAPAPEPARPTDQECWGALAVHLLGIPTIFVGPLIVWLIKHNGNSYVEHHAREATNFQITMAIVYTSSLVLSWCLGFWGIWVTVGLVGLGAVLAVFAAVAGLNKSRFKYPFRLKIVR